jgi:hypothetical protein
LTDSRTASSDVWLQSRVSGIAKTSRSRWKIFLWAGLVTPAAVATQRSLDCSHALADDKPTNEMVRRLIPQPS